MQPISSNLNYYIQPKLVSVNQYQALDNSKQTIVFTNGVFDILHLGHLTYLAQAKALGNKLIIGLNSDNSVKQLGKGDNRPINNELSRKIMLASLSMVDYVIIFEEQTPINLIMQIKPNIYVKGGDYNLKNLPEASIVQSYGGRVEILAFIDNYSTSSIINKIKKKF